MSDPTKNAAGQHATNPQATGHHASDQHTTDSHHAMDQQIDAWIGILLRTGVLLAAALVGLGGIVFVARHPAPPMSYHAFEGEPAEYRTLEGIVRDAASFHGRGLIQLGLLLLIATPVARVAFSVAVFSYEKDWIYVAVS